MVIKRCHTTDAPERMNGTLFLNVNNKQVVILEISDKYNYTMMKYGATFYSRQTSTKHKL